ncbi:MAG: acetate kinase [Campylobacter sp.]|nr:acetate kinase [Campylobacter sp.]
MKILVLNSGSSSIKFQLFLMEDEKSIASGLVEKIGLKGSRATLKAHGEVYEITGHINDHHEGLEAINELLKRSKVINSLSELDGIGHRVVHGGESFTGPALVDENVIKTLERISPLAPLHNPGHIAGIRNAMQTSGDVPHVVVFDTIFHQTMPEYAYSYALPYDICKQYHVRKYGFHGTSHSFVCKRAADTMGIDFENFNAISLHLGNGASICAVKNGKSIDTSMGFSPLEGLVMGTRSGDIDPAAIVYLMDRGVIKHDEIDYFLNKKSGLLGICGSSDMRDIIEKNMDDERTKLAFDMFCYRAKKYIGAYYAVLGHVDAIVFTGGIGENAPHTREGICEGLEHIGIAVDKELNYQNIKGEREITDKKAKIRTFVIPTNEELEIARQTKQVIEKL